MFELTIGDRVNAGIAWLDEQRPGWANIIDLDRLDLSSSCRCILGQTYGDYWHALDLKLAENHYQAVALGFNASFDGDSNPSEEYEALEVEWRRRIGERRLAEAGRG